MSEITTLQGQYKNCAGIDVGKAWLDIALDDNRLLERRPNSPEGYCLLLDDLHKHAVRRVGLEATGGYEQQVLMALRKAGLEVHLFQPRQVRAYATFIGLRAKSDAIDAKLIARCTARLETVRAASDERLSVLSQAFTLLDQMAEDIARAKVRRENVTDAEVLAYHNGEIKRLKALRMQKLKQIDVQVRQHPDLAERLDLILSIFGVGLLTALMYLIRMPELGSVTREEAAALVGVAPMLRESGSHKGERHVAGGRERVRTSSYACVQIAIKWNPELKAFYNHLRKKGKHHRCAIIACSRKLITIVNAVLHRKTPWLPRELKTQQ